MEITEIRIKLLPRRGSGDKLRGYCTVTLDGEFVVRDLKIIEGVRGIFVAMPSRRLTDRCPRCHQKNHLRAKHCNECGCALDRHRGPRGHDGRVRLHVDVAHPINAEGRARLHDRVMEAFRAEEERSREAGYVFTSSDDADDFVYEPIIEAPPLAPGPRESEADEGAG